MAASANPLGNNQEGSSAAQKSTSANGGVNSRNGGANTQTADTTPTASALRHNTGISLEWTPDEQSILEDLLAKFSSDSTLVRYAKIAMQLKDKTVRDVALRCRWMTKKENGKRRKEDYNSARKNKDRKEKATDSSAKSSSQLTTRLNGPLYAPPLIPMDTDDGISYKAIGGVTGELLEQNSQMFNQISANFASFQIHDNIDLLCKARDNILSILNEYVTTFVHNQFPSNGIVAYCVV
ncbi:uncharacterized protein LOC123224479 isoform X2 [Mangifera indica]|uniref:uncharacterized protein LOC123224479 isoform X2 n=1 Tax=Mangifera indica TaxID=29780 RepID=UPI001CFB11FF|nr:uncharacterized protein LOC123224479 isoform X2 [Mangifera indica]XP_044504090.1 uncharacterized protein LOC123224479 isoform X2 [Mangifera indica]